MPPRRIERKILTKECPHAKTRTVECKKEGVADGFLIATSRFSNIFVNLLFGHGIGTIIDHYTGKAYEYPNDLPVKMGESATVDKRQEQQPASAHATEPNVPRKTEK